MVPIFISEEIKIRCPQIRLGCIECDVVIEENIPGLNEEISKITSRLEQELDAEKIRQMSSIKSSKEAYKKFGKDPNRYRLSAESLLRRIANKKGLYKINNVVDLLNLVSVNSGFSIGGYDVEKIKGRVTLRLGKEAEPYKGIGRGDLNIENLPMFCDETSVFGCPTSDSLRTMVSKKTKRFLMVIFDFGFPEGLEPAMIFAKDLLAKYSNAKEIELNILE